MNSIELTKDELIEVFVYLNERLKENQIFLDLTVYGDSIMTLTYDGRPATRDVDCIYNTANDILLENILSNIQNVFCLQDEWLNSEVKEPLKLILKEDIETFKVYSNLKILKPVPEQLLAMKLLAARPEPSKDFIDARLLCEDLNIKSKKSLIDVFRTYFSRTLLGERQLMFIKYLGEDMGYDWK